LSSVRKKAIVSACILGEYCRYDGKTKEINSVKEALKEYDIISFCPEAPLFGTPRERINVVKINNQTKIMTDETNKDVTALLTKEIATFIKENPEVDKIILKSKSPSCGYKTTPILDESKNIIGLGDGIAAEMLEKAYPNISLTSELDYLETKPVI